MSWLATNYEKAALGGAAVCALGLAYLGWSALNRVDEDFVNNIRGQGKNNTAIAGADRVARATASLGIQRQWEGAESDGRPVDLFVSVPLFVTAQEPGRPVDLLKDKDNPVHPPIPNTWWLENRIDPGFEDSPSRDPDGDGFSNLEEFTAGTNPNEFKSHPPLIAKLKFVGEETLTWALRPAFPEGPDRQANTFRYLDNHPPRGRNLAIPPGNPVESGSIIPFEEEPAAGRFKFLRHETREFFNERIGTDEIITLAIIEDQRPNKLGTIYEFPAPLGQGAVRLHQQFDRTAVFTLEAIGLGGQEFKVEEFTAFTLPPNADNSTHKLLSVNENEAVVEFTDADGNTRSVTIPKGSMPQM